jgi:hypothetical protein
MSKELTTTNEKAVALMAPEGYQAPEINRDDVAIPSIVLWQKMTDIPEFDGDDVKPGEFVNPVTMERYGTAFEAAVIGYHITARIFGPKDPKTSRKETIRFSADGIHWNDNGDLIQPREFVWMEDGSNAVKSYHFLVLVKGSDIPGMLTFKGASAKNAKKLNSNLMFLKPTWRSWFKFESRSEETNGNKYFVLTSKPQPKASLSSDEFQLCADIYQSMKGVRISSYEMEENPETNAAPVVDSEF